MAFDGTNRETCPNINEAAGQDRFAEFILYGNNPLDGSVDSLFGSTDFNRECFNICETGRVDLQGATELNHYIENGVCKPCPGITDTEAIENLGDMAEMCSNLPAGENLYPGRTEPTWYVRHQQFNLRRDFRNRVDWT